MNSIASTSPAPSAYYGNGGLQQAGFASHERFLNAYEEMDAGLTIQTREGDLVTLSANSFSGLESYEYNSQGVLQTEEGMAQVNQHMREISLYNEESFSFSVQGDLNEQELADIEAIVKGIDEIIGQMAQGDMGGAVESALTMGSFDSISMYQADITLARGYEYAESAYAAAASTLPPAPEAPGLERDDDTTIHVPSMVEKMAEMLEEQQEELLAKAAQPLESLFDHHLEALEEEEEEDTPFYNALATARDEVATMINDMVRDIFENYLDDLA